MHVLDIKKHLFDTKMDMLHQKEVWGQPHHHFNWDDVAWFLTQGDLKSFQVIERVGMYAYVLSEWQTHPRHEKMRTFALNFCRIEDVVKMSKAAKEALRISFVTVQYVYDRNKFGNVERAELMMTGTFEGSGNDVKPQNFFKFCKGFIGLMKEIFPEKWDKQRELCHIHFAGYMKNKIQQRYRCGNTVEEQTRVYPWCSKTAAEYAHPE